MPATETRARRPIGRTQRANPNTSAAAFSHAELADFLDNASLGLHWVDREGRIMWANAAELEMLGYSYDEYIGHNVTEFHVDGDRIADILCRLANKETLHNYEARLRCKDGSTRWVLISSNVKWENGEFGHTRCLTRDIMARKKNEQRLAAQAAVTRTLAESETLEAAYPRFLQAICERLDWDTGHLWVPDAPGEKLICAALWSKHSAGSAAFDEVSSKLTFQQGEGLPGRVWKERTPIWIPDVATSPGFPRLEHAAKAGLHAAFSFPILIGTEVFAVLEFFCREVRAAEEELIQTFASFGVQLGQFIDKIQMFTALQKQRHIAETIAENATACLFMMDAEGHCTYMNPAAEQVTGYTFAEVRGKRLHDLMHYKRPDGSPFPPSECPIDRALPENQRISGHEDMFVRRDGSFFPVVCAASPIIDNGVPVGTVVEVRDLTEEKRARDEIRRQQQAIRELSTPVLTLRDRLLILPIIGVLDRERSRQLGAQLLESIRAHRARVVVLDITGVATFDSAVGSALLKTVEASRLLGAEVLLTGVSRHIAQTLVETGVDLGRVRTLGDLRSGIEEAERILAAGSVAA